MDFEKGLERLETIVKKMEAGDLSLEDSLKLFEEGIGLSKNCNAHLEKAEQKVKTLLSVGEDGQLETEDFQTDE